MIAWLCCLVNKSVLCCCWVAWVAYKWSLAYKCHWLQASRTSISQCIEIEVLFKWLEGENMRTVLSFFTFSVSFCTVFTSEYFKWLSMGRWLALFSDTHLGELCTLYLLACIFVVLFLAIRVTSVKHCVFPLFVNCVAWSQSFCFKTVCLREKPLMHARIFCQQVAVG